MKKKSYKKNEMFKNYQIETISSQAPHKKVKVQRLERKFVHSSEWKWETSLKR